jgi:hypothetical protein
MKSQGEYTCFEGNYSFETKESEAFIFSVYTLEMEEVRSSETWVTTYNTTRVNPEDPNFIFRRCEHFISQVVFIIFIFLVLLFQMYACKAKLGKGVCAFKILKHAAYRHTKKLS